MKIRNTTKEKHKKYNYVYKLTFKYDKSIFYIGKRSTDNENDEKYLGSGRALQKFKKEFGCDCFEKEILSYWDTAEDALIEEKRLVTRELVDNPNCLNRIIGGGCFDTLGCKWGPRTEEQNKRNSESHKGLKQTKETIEKRSKSISALWQNEEYRNKQKTGRKGKYEKHLQSLSELRKNKKCIIKDGKWKYINEKDLPTFVNDGWELRGCKNKPTLLEIYNYREKGMSYREIGELYDVNESTVRKWKKKYENN